MALSVKLYKNFRKRDASTLQPALASSADSFSCTLKAGCSITDPVIDILSLSTNPAQEGYNYAYISQLNRYYFINDWRWDMGVWSASMSVDVLASFKSDIGFLNKYVLRSVTSYDSDLIDTEYPTKTAQNITYISAGNPFRSDPFGSFIVGIIGKSQLNVPNIGGINYYYMTYTQMGELINYLMSSSFASLIKDDSVGYSEAVVKAISSPTDYITSCIWFPFDISSGLSGSVQPNIGWWDNLNIISGGLTPLGGGFLDSLQNLHPASYTDTVQLTDHPQIARGNYLNSNPYSAYTFHLEPWGDIELPAAALLSDRTISFKIMCEGLTGVAALEIYAGTKLISRTFAQVGVSVSIAQIINDMSKMSAGNIISGAAAGVLSGAGKFNLKDAFGSLIDRIKAGKNYAKKESIGESILSGIEAAASDVQSQGVNGSVISYSGTLTGTLYSQGAYVRITRYNIVDEDLPERGRPLCSMRTLNTLTGYVKCADGDHNIAALEGEKEAISSYLTGGFFYE